MTAAPSRPWWSLILVLVTSRLEPIPLGGWLRLLEVMGYEGSILGLIAAKKSMGYYRVKVDKGLDKGLDCTYIRIYAF